MLAIKNLCVGFGETLILKNLSLTVDQGSTVGIIGPNGSGKTTLFNSISGFIPIQQGEIFINDVQINSLAPYARARLGLSRVFQNAGIFKQLSVIENINLALSAKLRSIKAFVPEFIKNKNQTEQAKYYLSLVGLADHQNKMAGALSGGQMRLLEMARSLASDAKVYLLDEPTAGVSPRLKDEVSLAIAKLIELKRIVLIIEHDMNFIRSFVDRIIVLDQGAVFMDDTPEKIMQSAELKEIYFGSTAL